jgi:signal transduction histidine kinase
LDVPGNGRRPAESKRIQQRFERLLAAGVAVATQRSLDRVLQEVVDAARDVVGARYAALGVLSEDGTSLTQFVTSGLNPAERERIGALPTGRGLLGAVIRDARPLRTANIARHPKTSGFPPHHPPMKSFLGVPVGTKPRVFGNLYLTEKIGAKEFNAEDETIAIQLAAQAATAIENARLNEAAERLLTQVNEMQRQRDLFFAMMNHELRNALTGVFGWAERLVRGRGGPEAKAVAALEVYDAADRTITLLNNFLDVTRLDAGKVKPLIREVDVPATVARVIGGLEPTASARKVGLARRCPTVTVKTDPVRFEQILVNLLSNAIRHAPQETSVDVTVTVDEQLTVRVSDHGPGVPVALRERIFQPFERFDADSGGGTGLGLAVASRMAALLGGSLVVTDTPGGGATFILTLPKEPPRAAA